VIVSEMIWRACKAEEADVMSDAWSTRLRWTREVTRDRVRTAVQDKAIVPHLAMKVRLLRPIMVLDMSTSCRAGECCFSLDEFRYMYLFLIIIVIAT
jgi:hypothetical protein